ncbi:NADH dehydrogenase (ubiquinone) 78K chain precursor, 5-prime end [Haplosporangium sp. Z 767]|nr:NADH dehydrogenase (ubiquinone) 78K chain precursor, 5-prime end [Haplosporangium sp. Z 767]KAF9181771.1 NADH dehydrogenase (ubiquinone) 78K chain precursor, 5-prime end [Haplosporangium sp. Z 11]
MLRALSKTSRVALRQAQAGAPRQFRTSAIAKNEVEVFVDGKAVKVEAGSAVIQACEKAGVHIPRFCYHERLSVAGNCRMCLVEVEKSPKPVASCAFPVMPGMKIKTDSKLVKKAREGVMEFLLANHPLDCPICDQGGECDLQDQSVRYGSDRGRFSEVVGKRAVEDKELGPLIKTTMTRCIHCTRCVRFANEVAGFQDLGTSGRGNDMQIGTYIEKTMNSEMSGNLADVCPVGALLSKPYTFNARPWELKNTESIDVLDALGSSIRVDSRGVEVMRILPRLNEDINEEWISDRTRSAYDGLKTQRLTTPMMRKGDTFVNVNWADALQKVASEMKAAGSGIKAIAGQLADAESLVSLKDLVNTLGSENVTVDNRRQDTPAHGADFRSNYLLNSTIAGVEQADALLLIGTNPRHEASVMNARIRKSFVYNGLNVGLVGVPVDMTYDYDHIGADTSSLESLVSGEHPFAAQLAAAKKPMIIVGSGVNDLEDSEYVFASVSKIVNQHKDKFFQENWNGYNVLQRAASRAAAYDIGFIPQAKETGKTSFVYLLEADEITAADIPKDAFVVYQGHHGDVGAQYADVILPGAAYTEKCATYVNTEGRPQLTRAAVPPPGAAREDWKIIRAISEVAGATLPYDDVHQVRERLVDIAPHFAHNNVIEPSSIAVASLGLSTMNKAGAKSANSVFAPVISDYYMTDSITRASSTMAKCSVAFSKGTHRLEDSEFKMEAQA